MVDGADVQFADTLAVQFGLGDHDVLGHQMRRFLFRFRKGGLVTQQQDGLFVSRIGHHPHAVAAMQDRVHIRHLILAVRMHQTTDNQFDIAQVSQVFYQRAFHLRVGQHDIQELDFLLHVLLRLHARFLLVHRDTEDPAHEHQYQDDADHAQRIRHGIPAGDIRIRHAAHVGIRLLRRTQTGGVGHRTEQHTRHRGDVHTAEQMDDISSHTSEEHNARGKQVEFQPALAKRREERRTDLQTNGIDKQDKPEILGKGLHLRVEVHAEMRKRNRHKQNPRHAKRDALELQAVTQENAQRYRQRKHKNRVRDA